MKCYNHPQTEAVDVCANCGKAICESCLVDVAGHTTCKTCLASGNVPKPQSQEVKAATPTNLLAIVSLVLGILGFCFGLPFSITAWITGHIARKQMSDDPNQASMQLANVGRLLGAAITILWIIGVICYVTILVGAGLSGQF